MKYVELKYVAVEYKHGWSLWMQRDGKKIMLGSAIKTEEEVNQMISSMAIEKEYFREKVDTEKEALKKKVAELEVYQAKFESLSKVIKDISEANQKYGVVAEIEEKELVSPYYRNTSMTTDF